MLFSSMTFLFLFLPITGMVYFVMPEKGKNVVLLAASFFFYFWGEPKYCILLAAEILLGFGVGWMMERMTGAVRKWLLGFGTAALLLLLCVFKYTDFFLKTWNDMTGMKAGLLHIALPLGISFYTFQMISYLMDVYRKAIAAEKNIVDFAAYAAMFPQLVAGPIVRYADIKPQLKKKDISWKNAAEGISLFVVGLAKKLLVADVLGELVTKLTALQEYGTNEAAQLGAAGYWVLAIAYMLQVYYDFSGYSDMAVGLGRLLGFHFPKNFDHPFVSKSITEFWRRWHMTLGEWFRDYLYIPLGGSRVSLLRFGINVMIVWSLSGLWHGASWNFVLWGAYFGVWLILEKVAAKLLKREKRGFGHVVTLVLLTVSFVLFREENLNAVGENLVGMFGLGRATAAYAWYEIKSYAGILAAAVLLATPYPAQLLKGMKYKEQLRPAAVLALFLLCLAFLLGNSSHPFLYFRF